MKPKGDYRVLLMCKPCNKVYTGSKFMDYGTAMRWYHNTLVRCTNVCQNKDCEEKLVPKIQCMSKPEKGEIK